MLLKELKKDYPCLYEVIAKMFEIIGVDKDTYDNVNVKEQDWFMKYEWTEKQQEEFKDWLYRKLYDDAKCRKEIMQIPIKKKDIIDKTVAMFVLNYGLKLKNKDSE